MVKNNNDTGVILMPFLPIRRRRWRKHGPTSGRGRGGLIENGLWWSRSGAIDVAPKMQPAEDHTKGGGPLLVVRPIKRDIKLRKIG